MKTNIFKTAMAWIGCITLSFCAFSCGDDDNPTPNTGNSDSNALVTIHYEMSVSEDLLNLYDIEATYLDENGQRHTGIITATKWSFIKSVPFGSAPTEYDCHVTATAKNPRPDTDKEIYSFTASCQGYAAKTSADGQSIFTTYGALHKFNLNLTGVEASNLDAYFERRSTLKLINYSAVKE